MFSVNSANIMEFTVPQFIERKPKIVGPLTFEQLIFIGVAAGLCIFLYFTVPLFVFIIAAIFLLGGAFALAFLKIQKIPLPIFIKNFFIFIFKPKIYLWKRKFTLPRVLQVAEKIEEEEEEIEKKPVLEIGKGSRLKQLFTYLETKQK